MTRRQNATAALAVTLFALASVPGCAGNSRVICDPDACDLDKYADHILCPNPA